MHKLHALKQARDYHFHIHAHLIMIMIMIMIEIQGKGTACKPDQYIISLNKINYKNIYLLSLK